MHTLNIEHSQFVPVVEEDNAEHVHHVLFYECHAPDSDTVFGQHVEEQGAQCHTANMPDSFNHCQAVFVAWAIGGEGVYSLTHGYLSVFSWDSFSDWNSNNGECSAKYSKTLDCKAWYRSVLDYDCSFSNWITSDILNCNQVLSDVKFTCDAKKSTNHIETCSIRLMCPPISQSGHIALLVLYFLSKDFR